MLATDPKATFKVVLRNYLELPEEQRPVFELRYLSVRDWKKVSALSDKLETCQTGIEGIDVAMKVIKPNLVGWENVTDADGKEIAFNIKKLEDILLATEFAEMVRWIVNQTPNFEDKKKSDLPSQSSTAGSASPVKV